MNARLIVSLIVIGLGSGRSGTQSLARLLNSWNDVFVTHESLKPHSGYVVWNTSDDDRYAKAEQAMRYFTKMQRIGVVGDVWSAHLPYVLEYMRWSDTHRVPVRFVVTQRECDKVADSFAKLLGENKNHLQTGTGVKPNIFDQTFPNYSSRVSMHTALFAYCEAYYATTQILQRIYPDQFRHFHLLDLHSTTNGTARAQLRDFLNISVSQHDS